MRGLLTAACRHTTPSSERTRILFAYTRSVYSSSSSSSSFPSVDRGVKTKTKTNAAATAAASKSKSNPNQTRAYSFIRKGTTCRLKKSSRRKSSDRGRSDGSVQTSRCVRARVCTMIDDDLMGSHERTRSHRSKVIDRKVTDERAMMMMMISIVHPRLELLVCQTWGNRRCITR